MQQKNKGKAKDFEALFTPLGYEVVTMFEVAPDLEIEETGTTFEENAILKAETLARQLGKLVIADDSGLAVDALEANLAYILPAMLATMMMKQTL